MTRSHPVSISIYQRHIRLFRYLNDAWIFVQLMRPELRQRGDALRASKDNKKKKYPVPKRDRNVTSRRRDREIGDVFIAQYERGIFETHIVSIVLRVETFIQECILLAIQDQPRKLSIIGEKSGIPLDLFLKHAKRDDLMEGYIALRCQDLMFGTPMEYISKAEKVLSIAIDRDIVRKYIEVKATRDIIVHSRGEINQIYLDKAGSSARGGLGEELVVNEDYFGDVIMIAKLLSGAIQRETEKKFG